MPTTNEITKQTIIDQLIWDPGINANDMYVKVKDGEVELTGKVHNYSAKMAAERNAYQVYGVNVVFNNLQIAFPAGSTPPGDSEIKKTVENHLEWNNEINAAGIAVDCKNHVLTLSGTVGSYWENYLITIIAKTTRGVLEVVNSISVKMDKEIIDELILKEIKAAFKRTHLIKEENISVEVNDGHVHLSGKVSNFFEKLQALNMAIYTNGVKDLSDDLKIWV